MGIKEWFSKGRGRMNKQDETPKPANLKMPETKPTPKRAVKKPIVKTDTQRVIKLVTNISNVRQWIGNVEILPMQSKKIDVSEGSMGRLLIDQNILAEGKVNGAEKSELTANKTIGAKEIKGIFKCPFCGIDSETQDSAIDHMLVEHHKPIIAFYLERYKPKS